MGAGDTDGSLRTKLNELRASQGKNKIPTGKERGKGSLPRIHQPKVGEHPWWIKEEPDHIRIGTSGRKLYMFKIGEGRFDPISEAHYKKARDIWEKSSRKDDISDKPS